ncbi:MAG: ImmA/IrrE family metallo-endopeptidase [Prolixibacteraceae bacterium]|jgi:Zn-dependent peptidase ImmA (M78 family)|nr:ImmA/IrrE family metallo-endopeptidase [Prolixibacteraceae bacterium]
MEWKIKANAANFRNRFGYSNTEPIDFKSLLWKLDILTVFSPLGNDFSGLSIIVDDNKFIFVNSSQSLGRQNFTICHELYHLYYNSEFEPHRCETGSFQKKNPNELNADLFASFLLLPEDGITSMIPDTEIDTDKIQLATLLKIEQTYSSSRKALLMRLRSMNLITQQTYDKYSVDILRNALQYGYTDELYLPSNKKLIIGPYGTLANKLFDENRISEGHYRELLSAIGVDINGIARDEDNRSE